MRPQGSVKGWEMMDLAFWVLGMVVLGAVWSMLFEPGGKGELWGNESSELKGCGMGNIVVSKNRFTSVLPKHQKVKCDNGKVAMRGDRVRGYVRVHAPLCRSQIGSVRFHML